MQRLFVLSIEAELLMLGLRDRTRLGSGCSFSRLASTGCRLKPLPFEGFCFLLFEDFSFLLLEGFSFGRLADVSLKCGCLIPFVAGLCC